MENKKPSIGKIVHYVGDRDGTVLPAIVTAVYEDETVYTVDLVMFGKSGFGFREKVLQGIGDGQWDWPPMV